jgi:uridine kinase
MIIVLIAGATASGKSRMAYNIASLLKNTLVISQDDFRVANGDSLDDVSEEKFERIMKEFFSKPPPFEIPQYDFATSSRKNKRIDKRPEILIVEGTFVLHYKWLRDMATIRLYLDVPRDECLIRRLRRDVKKRGFTYENILEKYEKEIRPILINVIEASAEHADLTVTNFTKHKFLVGMIKETATLGGGKKKL